MRTYVAFLRGINVGGRVIKMVDLKACFEEAGFSKVRTFLQSGNVLFGTESQDATTLRTVIESAVSARFGYQARIIVRQLDTVREVVNAYPFVASDSTAQQYVVFLNNDKEELLVSAAGPLNNTIENIQCGNGVVYWNVQKGMTLKSDFAQFLTKADFREHNTVRNLNTLKKIIDSGQAERIR